MHARARRRLWRLLAGAPKPAFCLSPPPLICAHGGDISAPGSPLANTLPAYRAALAHPAVQCVEVDVSRTRDDALVALHQRQLLAIADGEFDNVGDARLDQLKYFGREDEAARVLTLPEALDALRGHGLRTIILDIKDGAPYGIEGFAAKTLAAMQAAECAECLIWAKEDGVVREVIDAGHAPQAGFVLMNQTAEARQRGMHKLGRMPVRCVAAARMCWCLH